MGWWRRVPILVAAVTLGACTTVPQGPSVMVLPGAGKPLDQFQVDDGACRQWASQQVGATTEDSWMVQRRYDIAYQQCMYSRGNEIPGIRRPGPPGPVPGQRVPVPPPDAGTPPPDAPPPPPSAPPR